MNLNANTGGKEVINEEQVISGDDGIFNHVIHFVGENGNIEIGAGNINLIRANINVGPVIKSHRQNQGWSQEHLAKEVGLSRAYVSLLEQGKRTASLSALQKIAALFGKEPGELLASIGVENEKLELALLLKDITENENTTHLKELVTFARKLAHERQQQPQQEE